MKIENEAQFEIDRDFATQFISEQYRSGGYGLHFHRNVEIYGVVDGEVVVTIAGETQTLTDGQMAVVNCMEAHKYFIQDTAEIFYFHIGTMYYSIFTSLYKGNLLPRWLLDTEYNKILYKQVKEIGSLVKTNTKLPELKKYGMGCNFLSDIVSRYGLSQGGYDGKLHEFIEQVIQYIYDNYAEDITLESLANTFSVDPKSLSKKLSRCLGMDLRMFVNDVRAQKAIQLMNAPEMRGRPKKEVAKLCGFKTLETFYRVCERNTRYYK